MSVIIIFRVMIGFWYCLKKLVIMVGNFENVFKIWFLIFWNLLGVFLELDIFVREFVFVEFIFICCIVFCFFCIIVFFCLINLFMKKMEVVCFSSL